MQNFSRRQALGAALATLASAAVPTVHAEPANVPVIWDGKKMFESFEKEATIQKAYPNIFIVKYEEDNRNVTYSYTDVLTRTVEVEFFDGASYSPLIPPAEEKKRRKV